VVGNPPYIRAKDSQKIEDYKCYWPNSAAGRYALSAPFVERRPKGFRGWTFTFRQDSTTRPGVVWLDTRAREVRVVGATQGEMRRAMVAFMRLVDRKYPHVGRFCPLRYSRPPYQATKPLPIDKWLRRGDTQKFFEKIADPLFLGKPILRKEYERLYAKGNMDFAGCYTMRFSPYIFEPTYGDEFVYGYEGTGVAERREAIEQRAEPR